MALVWLVECTICAQRFALLPREHTNGKSTDALGEERALGRHECPHCHEFGDYTTRDLIPGEGRVLPKREPENL